MESHHLCPLYHMDPIPPLGGCVLPLSFPGAHLLVSAEILEVEWVYDRIHTPTAAGPVFFPHPLHTQPTRCFLYPYPTCSTLQSPQTPMFKLDTIHAKWVRMRFSQHLVSAKRAGRRLFTGSDSCRNRSYSCINVLVSKNPPFSSGKYRCNVNWIY